MWFIIEQVGVEEISGGIAKSEMREGRSPGVKTTGTELVLEENVEL